MLNTISQEISRIAYGDLKLAATRLQGFDSLSKGDAHELLRDLYQRQIDVNPSMPGELYEALAGIGCATSSLNPDDASESALLETFESARLNVERLDVLVDQYGGQACEEGDLGEGYFIPTGLYSWNEYRGQMRPQTKSYIEDLDGLVVGRVDISGTGDPMAEGCLTTVERDRNGYHISNAVAAIEVAIGTGCDIHRDFVRYVDILVNKNGDIVNVTYATTE